MISDFRFADGLRVLRAARSIVRRIAALKHRAVAAGIPVVYVNDNRGRWRADFEALIRRAQRESSRGADVVRQLLPSPADYRLLKPRHSAFFATVLGSLLEALGTRRLILTGLTTDQCVLFTANDAYVRGFELLIPRDCVAAVRPARHRLALRYFQEVLDIEMTPSTRVRLRRKPRQRRRRR
jgi:nicotinamidase-related amidase